jgi:hypothetical protein
MNEHEKIVTIHIDEYLELKEKIKDLISELEWCKNQNSNQKEKIIKLKQTQKKWYHLF